MTDIFPYLERVRRRFTDPKLRDYFEGFNRTLLFEFTDLRTTYVITSNGNAEATLEEKRISHPDIVVTTSTQTLAGIMDRKVNPVTAYAMRKIKAKGAMEDLLKLQKLL